MTDSSKDFVIWQREKLGWQAVLEQADWPYPYGFWPLSKICLFPSDLVKSSNLQHKKTFRKSNRQCLENQQRVLRSTDSPCQTVIKFPEIHAKQFGVFLCFLFTPDFHNHHHGILLIIIIFQLCQQERISRRHLSRKWPIFFANSTLDPEKFN